MQFWPSGDEQMCSKHVEAWNRLIVKQKILCIKLANYRDKYTDMHGQQNVKKKKKITSFVCHMRSVFYEFQYYVLLQVICSLFTGECFRLLWDKEIT